MKDVVLGASRRPSAPRGSRWVTLALLPLAALLVAGCSGKPAEAKDSVSGKVTLGEKPVAGVLVFVYDDKTELTAPLNDGNYRFDNPKTGKVAVYVRPVPGAVQPAQVTGGATGVGGEGATTQGVAPPLKYSTQPVEMYEITAGKHTKDFKLTP